MISRITLILGSLYVTRQPQHSGFPSSFGVPKGVVHFDARQFHNKKVFAGIYFIQFSGNGYSQFYRYLAFRVFSCLVVDIGNK